MSSIKYVPGLPVNPDDLGVEVSGDIVFLPEDLRKVLDQMGVRSADSLVSALQSFPTAIASQLGLDTRATLRATAAALTKLKLVVDPQRFTAIPETQRRGMGAMPPGGLRKIGS